MECRAKISRKLATSYLNCLLNFLIWLAVACVVSTLLVTAAFPGEFRLVELLAAPLFGAVIGMPIVTAVWLAQGSWVSVCQGVVKQTVFRDGEMQLRLRGQLVWSPAKPDGRLLQIDPGTEIDVLQNVWGRQKVVWVADGRHQELVV